MRRQDVRRLLDRIGLLQGACDLDLLVFFARHPRALLTSEQLAAWLGYELRQVADSLERLFDAGVLTRTQNRTHPARLYVFAIGSQSGGWLPALLELASTRVGRLAILNELSGDASRGAAGPDTRGAHQPCRADRARPFVVRRRSGDPRPAKTG